jgi:hypothetical protein
VPTASDVTALVPVGVVTVTGTDPRLLPAGAVTVTELAVRAVTVALAEPNCTEVAEARSDPEMTTVPPPLRGPAEGLSPEAEGRRLRAEGRRSVRPPLAFPIPLLLGHGQDRRPQGGAGAGPPDGNPPPLPEDHIAVGRITRGGHVGTVRQDWVPAPELSGHAVGVVVVPGPV